MFFCLNPYKCKTIIIFATLIQQLEGANRPPAAPQVLLEQIVPFSRTTTSQKYLSGSLGLFNLAGVAWIGGSGVMNSAALLAREPLLMSVLSKVHTSLLQLICHIRTVEVALMPLNLFFLHEQLLPFFCK